MRQPRKPKDPRASIRFLVQSDNGDYELCSNEANAVKWAGQEAEHYSEPARIYKLAAVVTVRRPKPEVLVDWVGVFPS